MARVIFLQRIWYEYGGPEIISAILKRYGHQVDLLIGNDAGAFLNRIQPDDIIAFSIMSGEHHWALMVASEIKKKRRVLTVFGGPHPTYFPEIIDHPAVDVACCGEGEFAMLDLANAYDRGVDYSLVPNLSVKEGNSIRRNEVRGLISELDTLPFPDRTIYYRFPLLRKSSMKPFMASRGCPFSCSFCFNERLRAIYSNKGRYVRFRSPENLIGEIKEVGSMHGLKSIYFMDDLFALDQEWLKEFASLYKKEVKRPFVCSANVNTLNEEVIRLLKDSGCHAVSFGIETGSERLREALLNKGITNSQIEGVARLFKKYRLKFITFNMIGLPGETVHDALETVRLNIKIGADYPRCSILTPYPGTRISECFRDKIKIKDIDSIYQQSKISFDVPDPGGLYNLHYFFQTAIIFPYLFGLIKRLIIMPPNILFRLWWVIVYFFVIVRSEARAPVQTLISALRTFGPILRGAPEARQQSQN